MYTTVISTSRFSSELSGCEAIKFVVAATNQNRFIAFAMSQGCTGFTVGFYVVCVLIGRNHGELRRFTATQFR